MALYHVLHDTTQNYISVYDNVLYYNVSYYSIKKAVKCIKMHLIYNFYYLLEIFCAGY